jgi:predicted TIM-barrel fold metal-dependent hydrolase
METTIAVSRLIVSGTLDKLPNLKLLVAHAGAALPTLIGRLDSCVAHDLAVRNRLQHAPSQYLKKMYFDAISYSAPALQCLLSTVGNDRVMFGTDNPFFPPPDVPEEQIATSAEVWPSTKKVFDVAHGCGKDIEDKILFKNAKAILKL